MTLNDKIQDFESKCRFELMGCDEAMINDFIEYWTEKSLDGKKVRFMGEKFFGISRRFATWRSVNKRIKPSLTGNKHLDTLSEGAAAIREALGGG